MIKFILDPEGSNETQLFDQDSVSIGAKKQNIPPGTIDWVVEGDVFDDFLISVQKEENNFIVVNKSSSSNPLLNGSPFDSSPLYPGDHISVGATVIEFHGENIGGEEEEEEENFDIESELEKIADLFDDEEIDEDDDSPSLDLSEEDIEGFLEEVDSLEIFEEEESEDSSSEEKKSEAENPAEIASKALKESTDHGIALEEEEIDEKLASLIDQNTSNESLEGSLDHINLNEGEEETDALAKQGLEEESGEWKSITQRVAEYEEEEESEAGFLDDDIYAREEDLYEKNRSPFYKFMVAATILILVSGACTLGTIVVLRKGNTKKEIIAARGVCDISVALLHARAKGSLPYNNDPMDSDFLEENLISVLTPQYRLISPIHAENTTLQEESYRLHVIARTDLSKFVVLALPQPGLRQTLSPLPCIITHSEEMTPARSFRGEEWEQLIASTRYIEELTEEKLESLSRGMEPIRLSALDDDKGTQGFTLPPEIGHFLKEATTKIYNAPRYFSLTEPITNLLVPASSGNLTAREETIFSKSFYHLTSLPFLILYTTKADVDEAKEALGSGRLSRSPLVGQVFVNAGSELITDVAITLDEDTEKISQYIQEQEILRESLPSFKTSSAKEYSTPIQKRILIDHDHPLVITLSDEASRRQEALTEVSQQIESLLEEHSRREVPSFEEKQKRLVKKYISISHDYQTKITTILERIYMDHVGENKAYDRETFLAAVKAADLESLIPANIDLSSEDPEELGSLLELRNEEECCFESLIGAIKDSASLAQLNELVKECAKTIQDKRQSNPEFAIAKHESLRSETLKKVGELLLSPKETVVSQTFHEQNRSILNEVFDNADISDLEERQYYLNEFDLLMQRFRSISHQTLQELQKVDEQISQNLEEQNLDLSYRMELESQKLNVEAEIEEQRSTVKELKEQLSRLPIATATTSMEEQTQNLARLGQQVLIQASLSNPSPSRDEQLIEAVALLTESTNENRSLWEDILEARRLITESPKEDILEILDSDLGFSRNKHPMSASIRNYIGQYIAGQQNLLQAQDEEHYNALFEAFSDKYRENLTKAIQTADRMESYCDHLVQSMDQYVSRLEDFREDYIRAKNEGFFQVNRRYHSIMSNRLNRKLQLARSLQRALDTTCENLTSSALAHKRLCLEELSKLNSRKKVTPESTASLIRESNATNYPNLLTDNLNDEIMSMIEIGIYPVSQ